MKKRATDLTAVTDQRAKSYGDYTHIAKAACEIKKVFRSQPGWDKLSHVQQETMDMIAHKSARILAGNPNIKDHWVDIGGYAKITADRTVE